MSTDVTVRIGRWIAYGVNPLTWKEVYKDAVDLIADGYKQRETVRKQVLDGERPPLDPAVVAPSLFLREENEVVDFVGRADERARLKDWARAAKPRVAVSLLTGPPGAGKSRLARQVAREIMAEAPDPWLAGALELEMVREVDLDDPSYFKPLFEVWKGPLFLTLDYAERRPSVAQALIRAALAAKTGGHQIRILLVARGTGDWLETLRGPFRKETENPFQAGRFAPHALTPLPEEAAHAPPAEFERALKAFAQALGRPTPGGDARRAFDRALAALDRPQVLDVHMLALLAAYGETPSEDGADSPEERLLDDMLDREVDAWVDAAAQAALIGAGLDRTLTQRAGLWLGLADALADEAAAIERLGAFPGLASLSEAARGALARAFQRLYPGGGGQGWWDGFRPDRLASFGFGRLEPADLRRAAAGLEGPPLENLLQNGSWFWRRYPHRRAEAEARLSTALQGAGPAGCRAVVQVAPSVGDPVGRLAADWLAKNPAPDLARTLLAAMPHRTTALRELAAVAQGIVTASLAGADAGAERAAALNGQSIRLADLGRREEALAAIEEATALYRTLAAARPDAFRPDLATSLSVLGDRLGDLARWDEAVAAHREAVATLAPAFFALPAAFAGAMATYARDYMTACEQAGAAPDDALLAPIAEALQGLGQAAGDAAG